MGDEWDNEDLDDLEMEEEMTGSKSEAQPLDHVVICIDGRANMMQQGPNAVEPQLAATFRTIQEMLRQKIAQGDGAKYGVILVGTEKSENIKHLPHIHWLLPLDVPSVAGIRLLQQLTDNIATFPTEYGQVRKFPVHDAINTCMEQFREGQAKTTDFRRIFFFTNDDNPDCEKEAAVMRAKDAETNNIEIIVLPIQNPSMTAFDPTKFWEDIAVSPLDPTDIPLNDSTDISLSSSSSSSSSSSTLTASRRSKNVLDVSMDGTFEQLIKQIRRRLFKKRTYARIPLTLAPGIYIGLSVYNLLYPMKKPTSTQLNIETKQPVRSQSRYTDMLGETLGEHDVMLYHKVGEEKVYFTPEEGKQLHQMPDNAGRGLTIIGFQARECLQDYDNLRPPYFVYPSEQDIEGSTRIFRALWQRMIDRDIIAIASLMTRDNAAPRIVALIAEQERIDKFTGQQLHPPGIYAIVLPYADDLRNIQAATVLTTEGSRTAEQLSTQIIGKLQHPNTVNIYSTEAMIPNPSLRKFFGGLEALALNLSDIDYQDSMIPPMEQQEHAMGNLGKQFMDVTGVSHLGTGTSGRSTSTRGRGRGGATTTTTTATTVEDEGETTMVASTTRGRGRGRGRGGATAGATTTGRGGKKSRTVDRDEEIDQEDHHNDEDNHNNDDEDFEPAVVQGKRKRKQ